MELAAPRPSMSLRDLEERFAGRALAWVGGLALVAAAIFFLSLAFSRGWINQEMRVVIGLVVGTAAFGLGGAFLARANPLLGNALTAIGLGIISIALFAATALYRLVVPELGLAGALVAAAAAAALAVRFDSRIVAAYGLIAALVAPPLVGASPTLLTLLFVAVVLAGTTAIALFRAWRWLPPLAFVLAAPQMASWLTGDPEPAQALVALGGFWLVNAVAAAGEEVRVRRDDLRPSSATLILANGTFLLWGGFLVLGGTLEPWRGTFVAIASVIHLLVGGWFLARQGLQHLFGNLVAGTGVALVAIASFVQLGAPAVPVAWAAEAAALTWLAVRRRHRWSALAALVLGSLAVGHLVGVEYPLREFAMRSGVTAATPFLHAEGGSLAATLLAIAVAAAVVPVRRARSALAAAGVLVAAYATPFELAGAALAAALSAIAVGGLLLDRLVERLPDDDSLRQVSRRVPSAWLASTASLVAGGLAIGLLVAVEFPARGLGVLPETPFLREAWGSLLAVLLGLLAAGALVGVRWVRSALSGLAVLLLGWAGAFDVEGPALIGILVVLAPLGVIVDRALVRLSDDPRFASLTAIAAAGQRMNLLATSAGVVAWFAAAGYAWGRYLDPTLWGEVTPPAIPFSDERALVGVLLLAAIVASVRWLEPNAARRAGIVLAILTTAWVVPFEVYADLVVVLWVVLAAAALAVGRWDADDRRPYEALAALLVVAGAVVAFTIVATPDRMWLVDPASTTRLPLLAGWPAALVATAGAFLVASAHRSIARWRTWLEVAAGVTAVYLVSIAVVDAFQRQVGSALQIEELAKQAQVALSVTWTALGAGTLVIGLARRVPTLRHAGFGLLGVATAKVFVIDLASMDVAYRALVLAGLGLLLLVSAYLYTRFRGPRSGASGIEGSMPAG